MRIASSSEDLLAIFSARYTAMISESHSDWKRCPARLEAGRHFWWLVSWIKLCTTARSANGYAQQGVGAGDIHIGLGRHPHVADRVAADELVQGPVAGAKCPRLGVAEVLDDLACMTHREHLGAVYRLDVVREPLEVAVIGERHAQRVIVLARRSP